MNKISLPIKVGLLMTLGILLISAAGYLTFRNLSSIVASIQVNSWPDFRLLTIREIAADLDKAESSVRIIESVLPVKFCSEYHRLYHELL
jgi:hypothetical protein